MSKSNAHRPIRQGQITVVVDVVDGIFFDEQRPVITAIRGLPQLYGRKYQEDLRFHVERGLSKGLMLQYLEDGTLIGTLDPETMQLIDGLRPEHITIISKMN